MKLKFSAEVKREVNMSSTAWEKGPWGVKSLVRSLVGSRSFWWSSREGGMVTCSEKWCQPLSSGFHGAGAPLLLLLSPLLLSPTSQASDHCS